MVCFQLHASSGFKIKQNRHQALRVGEEPRALKQRVVQKHTVRMKTLGNFECDGKADN